MAAQLETSQVFLFLIRESFVQEATYDPEVFPIQHNYANLVSMGAVHCKITAALWVYQDSGNFVHCSQEIMI